MYENKTLAHGRYKVVGALGEGGMAYVFTAYDTRLRVERAIKILAPRLFANRKIRERFEIEASTMAQLHHKNILTIHDIGNEDQMVYMVMEMLMGGSLMDRIENHGPLHPQQAIAAAIEMASGLGFAHKNKVIHRDVKPHNVLISQDGVLKVADFGIARIEDGLGSQTRTGAVMGTLAYMAPEQKLSARKAEMRSDLYAVAASLYVMLTNDNPFELYDPEIQDEKLGNIIPEIAAFIRKGCHFSVDARHQNAEEMIADLNALRDIAPPVPPEVTPLYVESKNAMTTQQKENSLYPMWDTMLSEISHDSVSTPSVSESSETINFDLFSSEYSSGSSENMEEVSEAKTIGLGIDDSVSEQKTMLPTNQGQAVHDGPSSSRSEKTESQPATRSPFLALAAVMVLVGVGAFLWSGVSPESSTSKPEKPVVSSVSPVAKKVVETKVEPKKTEEALSEQFIDAPPSPKEVVPVAPVSEPQVKPASKPKSALKPVEKPRVEVVEKEEKPKSFGFVTINARPMRGLRIQINGTNSKKPLRALKVPVGSHAYTITYKDKVKKGTIDVGENEQIKLCWNFLKDKKC